MSKPETTPRRLLRQGDNCLQKLCAWGAIVSATLYLFLVYNTAILTQSRIAAILAIAAAGITHLAYAVGFAAYAFRPDGSAAAPLAQKIHRWLAPASTLIGAAAGVALLWEMVA